jgi:hypothetical protein
VELAARSYASSNLPAITPIEENDVDLAVEEDILGRNHYQKLRR